LGWDRGGTGLLRGAGEKMEPPEILEGGKIFLRLGVS